MKWYQQPWLASAIALFAVVVSLVAIRVQLRISREQRLWDERKTLYVDLLREQAQRFHDGASFGEAELTSSPEDSTCIEDRIAGYDLLGARTSAFASREVVNLGLDAVLAVQSYTFELATAGGYLQGKVPNLAAARDDPAVIAARRKWMRAEDRLTQQIRSELVYQRYRWWRAVWHRVTARRRPPVAPNF